MLHSKYDTITQEQKLELHRFRIKEALLGSTTFKPQLASDIIKLKEPVTFNKLVSAKLDGIRLSTWKGQPLTRSLKPIPNKYVADLMRLAPFLDGELIVGPPNAPDVYRKTFSGVMSIEGEPDFTYYIFDDLSDLSVPFDKRLAKLLDKQSSFPSWVKVLDQHIVTDSEQMEGLYARFLDQGYEGVMARNPGSMYKFGKCTAKSQDSLKIKPFQDAEAVVLEVYEAKENLNEAFTNELGYTDRSSHAENKEGKGMAGGFIVQDLTTGVKFRCAPGTLTHPEREAIWELKHIFEGQILTYRSMVGGVKDKPRHPRFMKWRSTLDM